MTRTKIYKELNNAKFGASTVAGVEVKKLRLDDGFVWFVVEGCNDTLNREQAADMIRCIIVTNGAPLSMYY